MNLSAEHVAAVAVAPFIGSFLSVLAVRLPAGAPVVFARSKCPSCGHVLGPADLAPLLSWLWRRGRCRSCGGRISAFYPAMEIAAAGVALWAAFLLDGWLFWVTCALGWTLLALAAMDIRDFVLLDVLTLPLLLAGLGVIALLDRGRLPAHLVGAVAGFAVLYGLNALYRRIRGREGLGLGDAKLLAAAGAWLGWEGLPSVLLLAAAAALAGAGLARLAGRSVRASDPVPFGAFLTLGFWCVWLYGPLMI